MSVSRVVSLLIVVIVNIVDGVLDNDDDDDDSRSRGDGMKANIEEDHSVRDVQ